ncbi:DUF4870 domain-containing protein [Demequina muriae]|uniref:DUF4870 domain-containing protein n=1 Tax=Demequina muriae TaxID=3051664 RepID=A0ABT8GJ28_9MICO|nr:DUF4870 domain-containing protein [Demequina sp. EGI L300058]MDN4481430.1 DUF4870 domain-containing protein [Demequina sp. EGI L300058]
MREPADAVATPGRDTALASVAHLGAMAGPLVPWIVYVSRRRSEPWAAREAATATNFGFLVLAGFVVATLVRELVPLLAFLGTLAQLVILIVAVALCLQAFRSVRRGHPATYPYEIKVVRQA